MLIDRIEEMETGEFLDTLFGLIDQGYVFSNKVNIRLIEEVERAFFRVNAAYSKDLRDAVNPAESATANAPNACGAAETTVARLSKMLRLWPWLAAILSGLLYAGCFAPFNQAGSAGSR